LDMDIMVRGTGVVATVWGRALRCNTGKLRKP